MNEVVSLVPKRTEIELAAEHRAAIVQAMGPVLTALDAAKKDGFTPSFALGQDFLGRFIIGTLAIQVIKNF